MFRAIVSGFPLGPIMLIVVGLLWSKAALLGTIVLLMLCALLVATVIAGLVTGGSYKAQRQARIAEAALSALSPSAAQHAAAAGRVGLSARASSGARPG
jgi:hypothetical protein